MWWFAVPAVIGLGAVVVDYLSEDEDEVKDSKKDNKSSSFKSKNENSQSSSYTGKQRRRNALDADLRKFKEVERRRFIQKHKIYQGNLYYPSKYRAWYKKENFIFENNDKLKQIEKEIQYIDSLLIEIQVLEKKYDKQKKSR